MDDDYQTYIDKRTGKPYRFIRDINEGGYTKDLVIDFDHNDKKAHVLNRKNNQKKSYSPQFRNKKITTISLEKFEETIILKDGREIISNELLNSGETERRVISGSRCKGIKQILFPISSDGLTPNLQKWEYATG